MVGPMNCWSRVDRDVLESILDRVPLADRLRCKGVCTNWRSITKTHIAHWLNSRIEPPPSPLLVIEEKLRRKYTRTTKKWEYIIVRVEESIKGSWFYSVKDDGFIKLNDKCEQLKMSSCTGSTNGWLIFKQDDEGGYATLFLYNPVLDIGIRPASQLTLPASCKQIVILSGDPITTADFAIVAITGRSVSFARRGDVNWTLLDAGDYSNIISCNKNTYVYALTRAYGVQAWDFSLPSPIKMLDVAPILAGDSMKKNMLRRPFFLLESNGDPLIIRRRNLSTFNHDHPLWPSCIAPHYFLYKLDLEQVKWVEESLGDRVIFLGQGQGVSYSSSSTSPGGYDKGVYCADHHLGRLTVESREIGGKKRKIELPAFWLVPPPPSSFDLP